MINRIHILGASGSGTTTLGEALQAHLGFLHFDTDAYYWLPSDPPFQKPRPVDEKLQLLRRDLTQYNRWVLTGSLCGWGDPMVPFFDLVVFLWIPKEIRMNRIQARESLRYGDLIKPGGKMHDSSRAFIDWAAGYDDGGMETRSLMRQEAWLKKLDCPILRIEGDTSVDERIALIRSFIAENNR